jgi:hypothetical protein
MKKLIIAAMATAAFAATPAFAQSSNQVNLNATVANACGVGNHISGPGTAAGFTAGDITNIPLADGNGQFNTAAVYTNRSFGNLWCNAPATVRIEVSPLVNTTPVADTGSFTNRFEVQVVTDAAVYTGGSQDTTISSVGGTFAAPNYIEGNSGAAFETGTGHFGGADSITILPSARSSGGNYRPIAGSYSGYVRMIATVS